MQVSPAEPSESPAGHFSAIGRFLWRHLSLLVIIAGWSYTALHRFSPRDASGWSLGHLFTFALLGSGLTWVLLWLLLKHDGQKLREIGLGQEQFRKGFLPGILFGVVIFAVGNMLIPVLTHGWFSNSQPSPLGNWFQSLGAIPVWIFLGWFAGGLSEEARRVFALTRFERSFGRAGLFLAVILSSVTFGIGHLYQGQAAAFSLGITGALYALVYLRRRSCWEAVVAHATFDTIAIGMMFYFFLGRG